MIFTHMYVGWLLRKKVKSISNEKLRILKYSCWKSKFFRIIKDLEFNWHLKKILKFNNKWFYEHLVCLYYRHLWSLMFVFTRYMNRKESMWLVQYNSMIEKIVNFSYTNHRIPLLIFRRIKQWCSDIKFIHF